MRKSAVLLVGGCLWLASMPVELAKFYSPERLERIHVYSFYNYQRMLDLLFGPWPDESHLYRVFALCDQLSIWLLHLDACLLLAAVGLALLRLVLRARLPASDGADTPIPGDEAGRRLPIALVLAVLTLLFWVLLLGDYHRPGEIADMQVFLGRTSHLLMLLAAALLLYGLLRTVASARRIYFVAVMLCSLPLTGMIGAREVRRSQEEIREMENAAFWSSLDYVAASFCDYYRSQPDRVHSLPPEPEEVTCDDFVAFCLSRPHPRPIIFRHEADRFLDRRNQPLRYFVHRDPGPPTPAVPAPRGCVSVSDSTGIERIAHPW